MQVDRRTAWAVLQDTVRAHWRQTKALHTPPVRTAGNAGETPTRRLALFVGDFPPLVSGGVYRPAALARYAAASGFETTVISPDADGASTTAGQHLLEYVGDKVRIHRFNRSRLSPSHRLFPSVDGGTLCAIDMFQCARQVFKDGAPSIIVATGPPFCNFVAGYLAARHFGCRLVLDYRDEWCQSPFDFVLKGKQDRLWEARCIDAADRIVFTTQSQLDQLDVAYGGRIAAKSTIVPNGWEPAQQQHRTAGMTVRSKVEVLFAGKLGGHTNPAEFLQALSVISERRPDLRARLTFRFVGYKHRDAEACLAAFPYQEMLASEAVVPAATASAMMRQADCLMLFHDDRFNRYLPGKLYEYVASGTPILLLDDHGESTRLIEKLRAGWSVASTDSSELERLLSALPTRQLPIDPESARTRRVWLETHTRESTSRTFLSNLDTLLE